ncbi:uncharacterized protein LOC117338442 [Pecten maximus]|uniref:uncharacterized protein LOC117338442 n=1 Tax=Pecten maximus TaxID=6579 RepID=UPI001457E84B|nr:uncharacterized protein LOC117338442 [Pecten maximus]
MEDQVGHCEKSWILHHIMDRMIGSRKLVDIRRKLILIDEYLFNENSVVKKIFAGSLSEGFSQLPGSDADMMFVNNKMRVMCSNQDIYPLSPHGRDITLFVMRNAASRPCYVKLELFQMSRLCSEVILESIVPDRDVYFISSEIYTEKLRALYSTGMYTEMTTNGPATTFNMNEFHDSDCVSCFKCESWPPVANEWLNRPRHYGWPDKASIYDISQNGCHLVPVGDKASGDAFLQWRISFATAERKLVHSLSHEQFLTYGLLKFFLKQISERLKDIIGDADILSSYIMKTVVFFAVENTPLLFWKEENTFLCFMLCLKILIAWINAGYCPHYVIIGNNMFQGKLNGRNKQKLLECLMELYHMNWRCLSVGTFIQPSIGDRIDSVMDGVWKGLLRPPQDEEIDCDMEVFSTIHISTKQLGRPLSLLSKSQSDLEEFTAYRQIVVSLSCKGMDTFGEYITRKGNKEKYNKSIRKCKTFMKPLAAVSTSPGQLILATYYYQTGNYMKSLELCRDMISKYKVYVGIGSKSIDKDRYQQICCGRGYSLLQKYQMAIVLEMILTKNYDFCPSQLHDELTKCIDHVSIPPLPYAIFLSFLCYHELGDTRRRDSALVHLRTVKYDKEQGCTPHWIVHNLIGLCYEMVQDTPRAIMEYSDSLSGGIYFQSMNPSKARIERLKNCQ